MILPTKLFPPPLSSHLVNRTRLISNLVTAHLRSLILVSAPAGFGKSTLLSAWVSQGKESGWFHSGWLSLDSMNNTLESFWAYFVAAWRSALPQDEEIPIDILDQIEKLLNAGEERIAGNIVNLIVNLMLAKQLPVVIVLDDYHQIQNLEIHSGIAQLIERLPANVHLTIATRFDPPLPIPRYRVNEQVIEIRAADLRFTDDETAALLEKIPGIMLTKEDMASISASTEGWAAGLKMAVLAFQAQPRSPEEAHLFWTAFTGRNMYILDYLSEEVLSHLDQAMQIFLIKTSILERLNDHLCAVVAFEGENTTIEARNALDQLDRSNIFLIPLDQERFWFRYHHLFSDILRARLQQSFGDQIPELHKRAAKWYEQAGFLEEAMHHSISGQDWEHAAAIIEDHATDYLDRGQLTTLLKWVESIPRDLLRRRPKLCIQIAWAMGHAGRSNLIGTLLKEVETTLVDWEQRQPGIPIDPPIKMTDQDVDYLKGNLAFFRAYTLILTSHPNQALQIAEQALGSLQSLEPRTHSWLNWVAGYACRGLGKMDEAVNYYQRALAIDHEHRLIIEDHSTDLGVVYWLSGRLEEAALVLEETLTIGEQAGQRNKGNLSRVEAYLSAVRMQQNRVEEGLMHARQAITYLQWWPGRNHIATAYGFLGLALLSTGSLDQAQKAIGLADQERGKGEVTPFVTCLVEMALVRLWVALGNRSALKIWVASQNSETPEKSILNEYEERHLLTLARAWIALGRLENNSKNIQQAVQLLCCLEASNKTSRRINTSVEVHLLGSLAYWELAERGFGTSTDAIEWLTRSLADGIHNGYRRVYIDEGKPLRNLLCTWLARDRKWLDESGVDISIVQDLMEKIEGSSEVRSLDQTNRSILIEPLTEREKDVLHLLALGFSNREMAAKLVVSEGTVKTHVHNLIEKLSVESRMQVLARAKELNLVG